MESGLAATERPESAKVRLRRAISSMQRFADWVDANRAVKDKDGKFIGYWTSNLGSGSDNAPRGAGNANKAHFAEQGWVDLLAQQVRLYQDMTHMWRELGENARAGNTEQRARELKSLLDSRYWNPALGFYFDLINDGKGVFHQDSGVATQASFWPLLTGGLTREQTDLFVKNWMTPDNFGGVFPAASLSSHHPDYRDEGGYWRGGRWPPSAAVLSRGFENQDRWDQAFMVSRDFVARMSDVAHDHQKSEGKFTVYEFYGVKKEKQGQFTPIVGVQENHQTREDFAGWGKTPVTYNLVRYVLGVRPVEPNLGAASADAHWLRELSRSHSSFFDRFTDLAHTPSQARLASRGYLEWNLNFDWPLEQELKMENFSYRGIAVHSMALKKVSQDHYVMTIDSEEPFVLQINRMFKNAGDVIPQAEPTVGSALLHVGGGKGPQIIAFELAHRAH